eukprot:ANDGO_07456.mRNA.1 hypothetical protein
MQKLFIDSCEKEPLPFSGLVLNYGVLIGISFNANNSDSQPPFILNISDNVKDHLGFSADGLLNQPLSVLIDSVEIFDGGLTKELNLLYSKTLAFRWRNFEVWSYFCVHQ